MNINENETWLTPSQVVARYPIGHSTLAKWRSEGTGGPAFSRIGERKILYRAADIEEFFAARRVPQAAE